MQKKILFLFVLFFISNMSNAQIGTVIVMNADTQTDKQTVFVKWYIDEVSCDEGVFIYRKRKGDENWRKITAEPFKSVRPIPKEAFNEDPSLKEYIKLFDETPPGKLKSIALLNVLLKSIDSDVYAEYIGILFKDKAVKKGETYAYKVMKLENRTEELIGISPEITAGEFVPVEAPKETAVTPGSRQSYMVWKPELQRYHAINIFRSSSLDPEEKQLNEFPIMLSQKINKDGSMSIPEPYFTDHGLENNVRYHYRLQAIDYFGRKSLMSDTVSVLIKDLIPPLPPYRLRAEQYNLRTTLKWLNDTSSDLFGMNVYRSIDDSLYQKINENLLPKTDTSYLDIAKKNGVFFYYVTALDADGNEARSPKVMVEIPDIVPPEQPTGLTALADTGKIHLSWKANTDEDLMGYIVYRRIKSKKNSEFAPVFADPLNGNTYTDNLNKAAKNYFEYSLAALDSSYNISEFSSVVSAQMPDVLPPNKPKFKKTWLAENTVMLEWIPNSEPDLAGYDLYRKEKSDTFEFNKINTVLLPPNENIYADTETENGKVYFYKLCALDSSGNRSAFSYPFFGAVKKIEANDSSNFKRISVNYNRKKNIVKIKWKISNEENCKGCVVYRKEGEQNFKPITGLINEKEYCDADISKNKTYVYQVRIYEKNGTLIKSEAYHIQAGSDN